MELIISLPHAVRDALPTKVTPLLPPSPLASSAMSAAPAQPRGPGQSPPSPVMAARGISRRRGHHHFTAAAEVSCLPAGCRVDASASRPLDSASTFYTHRGPVISCPLRLSSRLPLVRWLFVALPVVVQLRLASPFVAQPPHASILDPPSLIAPAGCPVAYIHTAN